MVRLVGQRCPIAEAVFVVRIRPIGEVRSGNRGTFVKLDPHPTDGGFFDSHFEGGNAVRFRYGTGKIRHFCGVHAIGIPNCDGVLHDVNHHVVDAIFKELVVE